MFFTKCLYCGGLWRCYTRSLQLFCFYSFVVAFRYAPTEAKNKSKSNRVCSSIIGKIKKLKVSVLSKILIFNIYWNYLFVREINYFKTSVVTLLAFTLLPLTTSNLSKQFPSEVVLVEYNENFWEPINFMKQLFRIKIFKLMMMKIHSLQLSLSTNLDNSYRDLCMKKGKE